MSHCTATEPPVATMVLLARVRLATKLTVLTIGTLVPTGNTRRSPLSVGLTAVTFRATARASDGMPQSPLTGNMRVVLARSGAAGGTRVSASRQGGTVKNRDEQSRWP